MPAADADLESSSRAATPEPLTRLPFPPLTKSHILHCSYHFWHPLYVPSPPLRLTPPQSPALTPARYRSLTPKARLIALTPPFLAYLRADGIILPPSRPRTPTRDIDTDSGIFFAEDSDYNDSDDGDDEHNADPSSQWPDIHAAITNTIAELGGSVVPKLNWSAPKDATWISATNSMECRSANDVYLLLKSSDFVTHDLEQVFDGCVDDGATTSTSTATFTDADAATSAIPYTLVLRRTIPALIPSLEFRCFVRRRKLLCMCQRDLNHYDFLPSLVPLLKGLITSFFEEKLRDTFPEENFVFDVYVPQPRERGRVWLIDVNPWAGRTDPLLFSWLEVLRMPDPMSHALADGVLRLSLRDPGGVDSAARGEDGTEDGVDESDGDSTDDMENVDEGPEFRLVKRDDPEAYSFNTPQYSAHKLPKDVVDAGVEGPAGLRDFMERWRDIVREQGAE